MPPFIFWDSFHATILFKLKNFLEHSDKTENRNQKYIFRINLNSLSENLRRHELKMSVLKLFSGGLFLIYAICPCRVPSNYLLLSLYHTALGHSMRFLEFFIFTLLDSKVPFTNQSYKEWKSNRPEFLRYLLTLHAEIFCESQSGFVWMLDMNFSLIKLLISWKNEGFWHWSCNKAWFNSTWGNFKPRFDHHIQFLPKFQTPC